MRLSTTINFFILRHDGTMKPYVDEMRRYRDLGYTALDAIYCVASWPDSPLLQDNWMDWTDNIGNEAAKLGINFYQSHLPYYNFADPKTGIDPEKEELIRRSIISLGTLGSKWTVTHPGTALSALDMCAESKKQCIEYYKPHMELADKYGLSIAVENMADRFVEGSKRCYCATVEELCDLADSLGNSGVCWDFGHANLMYEDQNDCLRYIGKRLKTTHVHDNKGVADDHLPPYFGNIKWEPLIRTLTEIGYDGLFSYEVKRIALHLPEEVKSSVWAQIKITGDYLLSLC